MDYFKIPYQSHNMLAKWNYSSLEK